MNIKCLFTRHNWEFAYNHGIPLGTSMDDALKMFEEGKAYAVDRCTRRGCGAQSYFVDGRRTKLPRGEMEKP